MLEGTTEFGQLVQLFKQVGIPYLGQVFDRLYVNLG